VATVDKKQEWLIPKPRMLSAKTMDNYMWKIRVQRKVLAKANSSRTTSSAIPDHAIASDNKRLGSRQLAKSNGSKAPLTDVTSDSPTLPNHGSASGKEPQIAANADVELSGDDAEQSAYGNVAQSTRVNAVLSTQSNVAQSTKGSEEQSTKIGTDHTPEDDVAQNAKDDTISNSSKEISGTGNSAAGSRKF
jgi:hypothetical protein